MRNIKMFQVDAFTERPLEGNPAGVVWDTAGLDDRLMQAVAREFNCSETVFVLEPTDPTAQLCFRYFTPIREVPLCGHATVAACHVGVARRVLTPGVYRLQTKAGILTMDVRGPADGYFLQQAPPRFRTVALSHSELAGVPGLREEDLAPEPPPILAFTGLWHLLVAVTCPSALDAARPDLAALSRLNAKLRADTTHVFSLTNFPPHPLRMRDFAPLYGVAEDPQTGTAAGALGAYLSLVGILDPPTILTAEQGHAMGRPGRLVIEVEGSRHVPTAVRVGGTAITVLTGELTIP